MCAAGFSCLGQPALCPDTQPEAVFAALTTVSSQQITPPGRTEPKRDLSWTLVVCQLSTGSDFRISRDKSLKPCAVQPPLRKTPPKVLYSETLRNVSKVVDSSTSKQGQLLTSLLMWFRGPARIYLPWSPSVGRVLPMPYSFRSKTEKYRGQAASWWWKLQNCW